jgi:hypothetical protein
MTAVCNGFCSLILEHEAVYDDLVRDKEIVAVVEESKDCAFRNLLKKTCISNKWWMHHQIALQRGI